jgi:hypothetical protein
MARPMTATGRSMMMLTLLEPGDSFYVPLPTATITGYASRMQVQVRTERMVAIEGWTSGVPILVEMTKVTLI